MVHVTLLRGVLRCKAGNRMVHASLQGITRYAVGRAAGLGIQAIRSVTTTQLETRRYSESRLGPNGLMHSPRHAPFFTTVPVGRSQETNLQNVLENVFSGLCSGPRLTVGRGQAMIAVTFQWSL